MNYRNFFYRSICFVLILGFAAAGILEPRFALAKSSELKPVIAAPSQEMQVGERLVYKITWLKLPVGFGELWIKDKTKLNGREVFHVIGKIETNKVLSTIFPVHNIAESWIDAQTLESVQFKRKIEERFTKEDNIETYDSAREKGFSKNHKTGENKEFDIKAPVHDVFSVFYWVRRQEVSSGDTLKTWLTADQRNWSLEVKVKDREKVRIKGMGKVDTIIMEPNSKVGEFEYKNKCVMNLTTDAKRIPVRVTHKAPFGSVVGTLQNDPSES